MEIAENKAQQKATQRKYLNWAKMLTVTGGSQILVQAIGLFCGILIIRLLPTKEYAFYVLANTLLGTMTVLADGGVSAGVMAQGAKVWNDKQKLGAVIVTGMDLRQKFAIGSLIIATPALIYLLRFHHASWLMTILICLALIPAFLAALSDGLLEIAPKLKQDLYPLQRNQIVAATTRLLMIVGSLFIFPWTFVAILGTGVSRTLANIRLRKISTSYADRNQKPDVEVRKNILVTVKRILPTAIYYCLSGQITIWLISFFGSTKSLSQVGALSGLTTALGFLKTVFDMMIVPRFARLKTNTNEIIKKFIIIQLGLIVLVAVVVSFVAVFGQYLLLILGHDFSNLHDEIVLITTGGMVTIIGGANNSLLNSRGMIIPPYVYIPSVVAAQVVLAFIVPLHTVVGILSYGIFTSVIIYVIRITYFFIKIRNHS